MAFDAILLRVTTKGVSVTVLYLVLQLDALIANNK